MEQAASGQCDLHGRCWKLVRLGDEPVVASPKQLESHLTVAADERRVAGSRGCNRVTGSFAHDGDRLRFGRMVSTIMTYSDGMDQEKRLLRGLERIPRCCSRGGRLEQVNGIGIVIARFDTAPPKESTHRRFPDRPAATQVITVLIL